MAEDEKPKSDGLEQFRKWLVPILLALIGVLGGKLGDSIMEKINSVSNKVDAINPVITKQGIMDKDIENLKEKVGDIKKDNTSLREDFNQYMKNQSDQLYNEARKRINKPIR